MSQPGVEPSNPPLMQIGWVLAADERDEAVLRAYGQGRQRVLETLRQQFPAFQWEMPQVQERRYAPYGVLTPLQLLELGLQQKLYHHWDYAIVVVPNELEPRDRVFTLGVPSSALEVAVVSSAQLGPPAEAGDRLAGLVLHLLGHLWGLEHLPHGPMSAPEPGNLASLQVEPFPDLQQQAIAARLAEVADTRVEEEPERRGWLAFGWRAFWADPRGIVTDIWGYAPWKSPFRMGRLSAAAALSIVFLVLGSEAWEVGVNVPPASLALGAVIAVLGATLFLFFGQNLGEIARGIGPREQLVRARIVLFCTLLLGMTTLWGVLFAISYMATFAVPDVVTARWLETTPDAATLARFAAFLASFGVLAGALGGNLEEEESFKARLLFDEEA